MIVCAVAEPEEAERPVRAARQLARRLGDELVLVHVSIPPPPPARGGGLAAGPLYPAERERLEHEADRLIREVAERCDIPSVRRRALVGDPATAVIDAAEELDAELIVLGSRRRGIVVSALLGSVSREIADATERPVVVVPTSGELRSLTPVKRIVCGVDASPDARRAVRVAHELATRIRVPLVLVSASRAPLARGVAAVPGVPAGVAHATLDNGRRLLEGLVEDEHLPPDTTFRAQFGAPADVLESVAAQEDAGLIVVGRRGGLLRDLLRGSVSAALGSHARRPVVLA